MQDFRSLRREAQATRNDSIAAARDQYDKRMREIGYLEAKQNGTRRHAGHGVMLQALPQGKFTYRDFILTLERLHPAKKWERQPVNLFLSRCCRAGAIRRLSRGVYVRVDGSQSTLVDAVASVLDRPMSVVEIAVTLLESGYRTTSTRRNFCEKIFKVMRREPNRFKRQREKWLLTL